MKRTALASILAILLLISFIPSLFNSANAETQEEQEGNIPPLPGDALIFLILSPSNSSVYESSNVSLVFNVTLPLDPRFTSDIDYFSLLDVWYEVDWQAENVSVLHISQFIGGTNNFYFNKTLANIPDGNHTIEVFANAWGAHNQVFGGMIEQMMYSVNITGCSSVNFITDTIPPEVSFLGDQNITYENSDITLNFALNKPVTQLTYSLDGKANTEVNGNTSLALFDLSNGEHNVTLYVKDEYGLTGVSNTLYFNVEKPSQILSLNLFSIVIVAFLILMLIALVIYRNKHSKIEANK